MTVLNLSTLRHWGFPVRPALRILLLCFVLTWIFLGFAIHLDGTRAQIKAERATFDIAEILSRETGYVTPRTMNGLYRVFGDLSGAAVAPRLRISVLTREETGAWIMVWSEHRGGAGAPTWRQLEADGVLASLPDVPPGDRVILVEGAVHYRPPLLIGDTTRWFRQSVTIQPRFGPQLCWNELGGDILSARC